MLHETPPDPIGLIAETRTIPLAVKQQPSVLDRAAGQHEVSRPRPDRRAVPGSRHGLGHSARRTGDHQSSHGGVETEGDPGIRGELPGQRLPAPPPRSELIDSGRQPVIIGREEVRRRGPVGTLIPKRAQLTDRLRPSVVGLQLVERHRPARQLAPAVEIKGIEGGVLRPIPDAPAHRRVPSLGGAAKLAMAGRLQSSVSVAARGGLVQSLETRVARPTTAFHEEHADPCPGNLASHGESRGPTTHDADLGLEQRVVGKDSGIDLHQLAPGLAVTEAPHVTVIMPTLATAGRGPGLRRAIDSVLTQTEVRPVPLVVVNGPDADSDLVADLGRDPRIRLVRIEAAGLPNAIRVGHTRVDTPWFAELDDDDLLLPGALAIRTRALVAHPDLDVAITNGYRRTDGADVLHVPDFAPVRLRPLSELLVKNWLLPGSWLCRTERIEPAFFEGMPPYLECTYLAVRFALGARMVLIDTPTVAWRTGGGLSSSRAFQLGQPAALERILELDLPADFRAGMRRHLMVANHSAAELYRAEGDLGRAWKAHLHALGLPGGAKYLLFTRYLLTDSLRKVFHVG